MPKIIASNFKTNHTRKTTLEFCNHLEIFLNQKNIPHQIRLFPPNTALLENNFRNFKNFSCISFVPLARIPPIQAVQ
ncbi:MAG: triose-phosphate isomerase, partial [Helicobacter sp.]|nr:triose-phosphate isomerase [Helicobacter sp.]